MRLGQAAPGRGIHPEERRLAAAGLNRLHPCLPPLRVATKHGDLCARFSQTFRQRAAEYARCADDNRHFA